MKLKASRTNHRKLAGRYFRGGIILFILGLTGCATVPPKGVSAVGQLNLRDFCRAHEIRCQLDNFFYTATLTYKDTQANLLIGSPLVLIGEQQYILDTPVVMKDSAVMVPADFQAKFFQCMEKTVAQPHRDMMPPVLRKIVIDPGHGGKDPGAIGPSGLQEKKVNLDIAKRLKRILKKEGIEVIMTRESDVFISLPRRTEIASQSNADLFVSVHANSSPVRGVNGMEVFSMRDLEYLEKNDSQRRINHEMMFDHLSMNKFIPDLESILEDMLYCYKKSESHRVSETVSGQITSFTKVKEKEAGFYVLRNTLIPSILVEVGYLTNPKEGHLLSEGIYRQKVAEILAQGLLRYAREIYAQTQ